MGYTQQLVKKIDRLTAAVRTLLDNRGISDNTTWWTEYAAQQELERLAESRTNYAVSSNALGITQKEDEEKLIFASYQKSMDQFQDLIQSALNEIAGEAETKSVQLVFFADDMRSRARLEAAFARKLRDMKSLAQKTAKRNKGFSLFFTCILVRDYDNQEAALRNLKRYDMLQEPPVDRTLNLETSAAPPAAVQTLVFTTDLYQLVELYNLVGDQLFQNNVRFGINETMGVDQSIRETLRTEPELFWYKNNGITLLVLDRRISLYGASKLVLGRLDPESSPGFSVVNGAQTITTAAQYFFKLEYDQERCQDPAEAKKLAEELKRARENAKVLVRVTLISQQEEGQARRLANAISVALNRQKPIRIEDIAFTSPAVHKMAEYLRARPELPDLVRRGEGTGNGMELTLTEFVRARMACAGLPGAGRNKSANELLRFKPTESNPYAFSYKELFSDAWLEAEGDEETAVFNRDYQAIWFAHQTARDYDKCAKKVISDSTECLAVVKNGKWYFTAVVIQAINAFRSYRDADGKALSDFSQFNRTAFCSQENLVRAIACFADFVVLCAKSMDNVKEINSNLFKNEKLYHSLIQTMQNCLTGRPAANRQDPRIDQSVQDLMNLLEIDCSFTPAELPSSYVRLGDAARAIVSDAQALGAITNYILSKYPIEEAALLSACSAWLTADPLIALSGNGYFRGSPQPIQIGGTTYWIGTSSNTPSKRRHMKALCSLAGAAAGEVEWYKNGQLEFSC